MPPKGSKRLQLQFGHLQDMIKEQNRMVLAEVEPTATDREDMIELLESVKKSIENEGPKIIAVFEEKYQEACTSLSELGYLVSSYNLIKEGSSSSDSLGESKLSAKLTRSSSEESAKSQRRVRFDIADLDEPYDLNDTNTNNSTDSLRESLFANSQDRFQQYSDDPLKDGMSSQQLYDENHLIMEDQDRRLEQIGGSVGRQRAMGETINGELTYHNNLLEDMEAQVDRSGSRLDRLTHGVTNFNRKSREGGTCTIILVLLLILFVLLIF